MRRRNKTGGKEGKTQRPKTLKRRNRPSSVAPDEVTDVARLTRERDEALARETATSEVLQVISSSPGKLEPVFEAMLANAVRICEAKFGTLYRTEGDSLRCVAMHGVPKAYAEERRRVPVIRPAPTTTLARALATKRPVQIADVRNEPLYPDAPSGYTGGTLAKLAGARTLLAVPMLTDVELVGAIIIYRQEVRPFTDKQIELVQNFAAQAVIAIENTRLLSELRQRTDDLSESLEQQTATSEVLKVISSSPGVLEPVFNAMLENAVRICSAKFGILFLSEGDAFRTVALHGAPPAYAEARRREPVVRPRTGTALTRASMLKQPVQIADVKAEPAYHSDPSRSGFLDLAGARTVVAVPMLKEGEVVGAVLIYRQEVRPFTDKQIDLLTNFAAQAVIAIENTRLLSELRESLQQQTATADVLKVISRSTFDLEAVLDTLLESATRLCEGHISWIFRRDGEILRWAASYGHTTEVHAKIKDYFRPLEVPVDRGSVVGRAASEAAVIHIPDVLADPEYKWGEAQKIGGYRASLGAPLLREGNVVGVLFVAKTVPQPFTDKQIELVKTFADQAVIAIENTRLLNELRESLQQQTATADVLKVISRSTFDLQTVLDTLTESAARLCEADMASIARPKGAAYNWITTYGFPDDFREYVMNIPISPGRESLVGRVLLEGRSVQIADVLADCEYGHVQAQAQKRGGYRTVLGVPLLREGKPIGVIFLSRKMVRPFTDKQIELVSTFADQAVIAIENVRLFERVETRTRELAASLENLRTTQDRLVQTQKLASLGQLTAGIAHEIKNPLNFVNNFSGVSAELIDELQEALKDVSLNEKRRSEITELMDTLRGNLDKVVQHGKRADAIVKNMLLHSREGSGEHRVIDINGLVEESLNLAWHGARAETQGFEIKLRHSFDPSAGEADVFPQDIRRALLNLIANGFYAAIRRRAETNGGDYEPTLTASTKNLGDRVEISIRDNGTGIAPDVKEKMFEPFFTTKPTGEGTGLGLSISHDVIVKQHAGTIEVDTQPGEFTEIRIVLPRTPAFV